LILKATKLQKQTHNLLKDLKRKKENDPIQIDKALVNIDKAPDHSALTIKEHEISNLNPRKQRI